MLVCGVLRVVCRKSTGSWMSQDDFRFDQAMRLHTLNQVTFTTIGETLTAGIARREHACTTINMYRTTSTARQQGSALACICACPGGRVSLSARKLDALADRLASRDPPRGRSKSPHPGTRSSSPAAADGDGLCKYHARYRDKARRCVYTCPRWLGNVSASH